jgi:hypothetical protein
MRSLVFLISLFLTVFMILSHAYPQALTLDPRTIDRNGTARGNGTSRHHGNKKANRTCRKFSRLTRISELANNQTRIDALVAQGRIKEDDVDRLRAKGEKAAEKLQEIRDQNATLAAECAVFAADRKVGRQCKRMRRLKKLSTMHDNQTAIEDFAKRRGLSEEKITTLQVKIAEAPEKLAKLQANSTLVDLCARRKQEKEGNDDGKGQIGQEGGSGTADAGAGKLASCSAPTSPSLTPSAPSGTPSDAAPLASTGGADALVLRTLSYVLLPCLASALVVLL